jgi:zinc transporter ZupT
VTETTFLQFTCFFLTPINLGISVGHPGYRVAVGFVSGIVFILVVKKVLDGYDDLHVGNLGKMDSQKVLLMMCVMTLHSFSEGVGIGVSFGELCSMCRIHVLLCIYSSCPVVLDVI